MKHVTREIRLPRSCILVLLYGRPLDGEHKHKYYLLTMAKAGAAVVGYSSFPLPVPPSFLSSLQSSIRPVLPPRGGEGRHSRQVQLKEFFISWKYFYLYCTEETL